MTRKMISDMVGNIEERYVREAADYAPAKKTSRVFRAAAAAVLALALLAGGIGIFSPTGGTAVAAYAYGTDEEITRAGTVMSTGTISDSGEMTGHPLMFFLAGEGIESVRFSCKNQLICFTDWTEQREEFGNAQNFTVPYGADADEYYFMVIDWVPNKTVRALTDDAESTIATLPVELREDVIVLEIQFENGEKAVKAITVTLREDGSFVAAFDDYTVKETDEFVRRTDAEAIPREVLYGEMALSAEFLDANGEELMSEALWYNMAQVETMRVRWTGATPDLVRLYYTPAGTETIEKTQLLLTVSPTAGEELVLPLGELDRTKWYGHLEVELTLGDGRVTETFNVFYNPELLPPNEEGSVDAVLAAARSYYEGTVFTVEELSVTECSEREAVLSALVSKGGVVQEPERTVWLECVDGAWTVVNEGY